MPQGLARRATIQPRVGKERIPDLLAIALKEWMGNRDEHSSEEPLRKILERMEFDPDMAIFRLVMDGNISIDESRSVSVLKIRPIFPNHRMVAIGGKPI